MAAPETAINQIALLKMMFRVATRWGYLKTDPAAELQRPRNRHHEIDILTPAELSQLVDNTEKHYQTAFRTAIMTGVRAGELWGLQWPDFQPATRQLSVRRTVWGSQFQMGHSSVAFTLDVYGHLFGDDQEFLRKQASLLAGALPARTREVAKNGSSKSSSSSKKKGYA